MKKNSILVKVQLDKFTLNAIKKINHSNFKMINKYYSLKHLKNKNNERFKHFKGNFYQKICLSFDVDNNECYVVYKCEKTNVIYHRKYHEFNGYTDDGKKRFVKVYSNFLFIRLKNWLIKKSKYKKKDHKK